MFVIFLLIIIHVSGGKTHSWQVKSLLLVTKTLYESYYFNDTECFINSVVIQIYSVVECSTLID